MPLTYTVEAFSFITAILKMSDRSSPKIDFYNFMSGFLD